MTPNRVLLPLLLLLLPLLPSPLTPSMRGQGFEESLKRIRQKKEALTSATPTDSIPKKGSEYSKLLKEKSKTTEGLFALHLVKGKLYLEIPLELLGKPMLFSGRVVSTSDNQDVIAGQMPVDPTMVEWSKDATKLYLHKVNTENLLVHSASINKRIQENHLNPILKAFPIAAWSPDSSAMVIDATRLFLSDDPPVSPFIPSSPFDALTGTKRLKGSFKSDLSSVLDIEAFPQNVNVRVRLVYTVSGAPFTAIVNAGMLLLPSSIMPPRYADERIGYFTNHKTLFATDKSSVQKIKYINRWRLEPHPKEIKKHRSGGLVRPLKPIVFYIDDAFPQEWKPYIREGIEDWQKAFERIGFKEAILARDFPKDDPEFNPSDARYSCVIYSASKLSNAMGPAWEDPRSGEIIQGSVYFYHNVLELLHSWRFIQTAAADPRARAQEYKMDLLGPLIRYVISHEIGHTLGLMHNMRGSYAYTIDQLRDPAFTRKWGTTASIMDYARCNYVAQKEDGVREFLPPRLGPYDLFAIEWGYRPIYEAKNAEEEVKTLRRWIQEKGDDPRFRLGEQAFLDRFDPAAQTEDLSNNAIEASKLGINNLKEISKNLFEWTQRKGEGYDFQRRMIKGIHDQFQRYIGHCITYIGGRYKHFTTSGDLHPLYTPVEKERQREALRFVLAQLRDFPSWITTKEVKEKLGMTPLEFFPYITTVVNTLSGNSTLGKVRTAALLSSTPYTPEEYLKDLSEEVWAPSEKSRPLTPEERLIQYSFTAALIANLDLTGGENRTKTKEAPAKIEAKGHLFMTLKASQKYLAQKKQTPSPDLGHYMNLYHMISKSLKENY